MRVIIRTRLKCGWSMEDIGKPSFKGSLVPQRNNRLGVRGVSFDKRTSKYYVRIRIDKKEKFIGRFNTLDEAAIAFEKEYLRNQ